MNKRIIQKTFASIFIVAFIFSTFGSTVMAGGRDCDGNAIIYCGTLTKTELKNKLVKGTGKKYQSSSTLKALYAKYGFAMTDIPNLKEGRVTDGNKVYVGGKVVASNVYTFGRHNIPGSTKVKGLSYPLYKRHPSVSFNSNSIDAYVYLNYDGTMAYAILKSCGNIVQGVGKKKRPAPPVTPPTPQPVRVSLNIRKYNDLNHDAIRDAADPYLPGWQFRVTGTNFSTTVTTDAIGTATVPNLLLGYYTVTEVARDGWESTTGLTETINLTADPITQTVEFGNYQPVDIPPEPENPTDPEDPVIPPPTGGGDSTPPVTVLAASGIAENIGIAVAAILTMVLLWYLLARHELRKAMNGKNPPSDPVKLIKELNKRTEARKKKILSAEAKAEKKALKEKKKKRNKDINKRFPQ